MDRAGSYSLGPPLGVDTAKTCPYWVDEIGKTTQLTYTNATQTINGLAVQQWQTNLPATQMLPSMVSAMHLPGAMPFATFEAQLKAQGTDLAAALRILSTSLTAAEKTRLAALTAAPIPLRYYYTSQSKLLIEPATGMIVDIAERNMLRIFQMWIPVGLGVIGLVLAGLAFAGRRRREPPTTKPAQPGPQKVGV